MRRTLVCMLVGVGSLGASAGAAGAATLPTGFQESTVLSGLTTPTQVDFASDGRVFVAEKNGLIKVFDNLGDTTPTTFADLRTKVHDFWDRGLLGLELAPNFPANPSVYVLYTHDAAIGGTAPRWGDACPSPPGPTDDGCVVSGRLSKLTADGNVSTGSEQVLIEDWCQQYPSHSAGDLEFGADGNLYVSGGDGASFNFVDYGQDGSPVNPCGDPPGAPGTALTPPTAEGGALRSQDVRTSSEASPPAVHFLSPTSDVTSQWEINGSTAWGALDDNLRQPENVPFENDEYIYDWFQGKVTEVALSNPNLGGAAPSGGKIWYYAHAGADTAVKVEAIWGGSVRASTILDGGNSGQPYDWRSLSISPPDRAAVDDLRIRFTMTKGTGADSAVVRVAYAEVLTAGTSAGDPTGLDGSILRVNPDTGAGLSTNPMGSSSDANARRMIAFGMRNPFRFAIRPGTNEVWAVDVGWNNWEEINRIPNPTDGTLDNFGWPCYEGNGHQAGYDSANLNLCESLYSSGGASTPYFAWDHGAQVIPGEGCPSGGSSASGVDFYTSGPYPADHDNAMYFADYSRDCIWVMKAGAGGLPSTSQVSTFVDGASNPVDVTVGPDGLLYYPDFDNGTIRRVNFTSGANQPPNAVASANPTTGAAPLTVQFTGSGSSDPDPADTLTYAWDLDGDGQFDDSTSANPSRTYSAGTYTARLQVSDGKATDSSDPITISAGNTAPQPTINTPAAGTLWQVGQSLGFSGGASDAQDGTLAASRLSWRLDMEHCPSTCHTHTIQSWSGIASGSFVAPDHEYPSHLVLRLTATDSGGLSTTVTRQLDPRTVAITMATSPKGLQLTLNSTTARATYTRTVILGSRNTISAPTPQKKSGKSYAFSRWSDGGARTHDIIANGNATYTATFNRVSGAGAAALCQKKAKKGKKKKKKRRC